MKTHASSPLPNKDFKFITNTSKPVSYGFLHFLFLSFLLNSIFIQNAA